jgi:hypothetical protein
VLLLPRVALKQPKAQQQDSDSTGIAIENTKGFYPLTSRSVYLRFELMEGPSSMNYCYKEWQRLTNCHYWCAHSFILAGWSAA